jgi:predicted GNAT family N-acyltransferase
MGEAEYSIRWAEGPADISGARAVRFEVFCREQGVSLEEELDGRDDQALHIVVRQALEGDGEGPVIATLRLLVQGEQAKVGRVAVGRAWRRQGIASRMLALALERSRGLGCTRARLAAQLEAAALYEQAGFSVESEVFEEAGMPHVWMGRDLASAGTGEALAG